MLDNQHWESMFKQGSKVRFRCDTEGQCHTLQEQTSFHEIWIPISHAKHCTECQSSQWVTDCFSESADTPDSGPLQCSERLSGLASSQQADARRDSGQRRSVTEK